MAVLVRLFLIISGLLFVGFGMYFFLHPAGLGEMLGHDMQSSIVLVEIGATYGGLMAALGILQIYCGAQQQRLVHRVGLWLLLTIGAGFALGRAGGILMLGGDPHNYSTLLYEAFSSLICIVLLLYYRAQAAASDTSQI